MNDMTIAKEILNQLGGNRFLAMTGSHSLCADNNSLIMNLRRNKLNASKMMVELKVDNTYTIIFYKIRNCVVSEIKKFEGIYNDMLVTIFEKETGLYTSL